MLEGDQKGQGKEVWGKLVEGQKFAKFKPFFFSHLRLREKYLFASIYARVLLGLINK